MHKNYVWGFSRDVSHFLSILKVLLLKYLLLPEVFPVCPSGKLPTVTATFSFLDCICRLKSETITSIIFNLFFPIIFQKRAQWFSVIFSSCLHYQFFQPMSLGTYCAWEQTFRIIGFNRELSNNKLLQNPFLSYGRYTCR